MDSGYEFDPDVVGRRGAGAAGEAGAGAGAGAGAVRRSSTHVCGIWPHIGVLAATVYLVEWDGGPCWKCPRGGLEAVEAVDDDEGRSEQGTRRRRLREGRANRGGPVPGT